MFYDVTIKGRAESNRKITDIKALRGMTFSPAGYGVGPINMGLMTAKNAIETMYDRGEATVRMTPEQFAAFDFNYRYRDQPTGEDYSWWIESVKVFIPTDTPAVFTF